MLLLLRVIAIAVLQEDGTSRPDLGKILDETREPQSCRQHRAMSLKSGASEYFSGTLTVDCYRFPRASHKMGYDMSLRVVKPLPLHATSKAPCAFGGASPSHLSPFYWLTSSELGTNSLQVGLLQIHAAVRREVDGTCYS